MRFRSTLIKGSKLLQHAESFRNPEGLPRQCVIAFIDESKTLQTVLDRLAEQVDDPEEKKKKSLVVLDAGFAPVLPPSGRAGGSA